MERCDLTRFLIRSSRKRLSSIRVWGLGFRVLAGEDCLIKEASSVAREEVSLRKVRV